MAYECLSFTGSEEVWAATRSFENTVERFYEMLEEVEVDWCVRNPKRLSSISALSLAVQSESRSVVSLASQSPEFTHLPFVLAEFRKCIEGLAARLLARLVMVCHSVADACSTAAPKSVGPISP